MTIKHTPGPWTVDEHQGNGDLVVRSLDSDDIVANCQSDSYGLAEQREMEREHAANAQLMSAAPELLAACKEAVGQLECNCCSGCEGTCSWAIVHNAIAKAEGPMSSSQRPASSEPTL